MIQEAVEALMARYFHFVDTKQWQELRSVLADDMAMAAPDDVADTGTLVGADRVVDMIERVLGPAVSAHRGVVADVELVGPAEARAICAMEDVVEYPDAPERSFRGRGHYRVTCVRTPAGWRIGSLVLRRSHLERG